MPRPGYGLSASASRSACDLADVAIVRVLQFIQRVTVYVYPIAGISFFA